MKQKPKTLWSCLLVAGSVASGAMASGERTRIPDRSQPAQSGSTTPNVSPSHGVPPAKPALKSEGAASAAKSPSADRPTAEALRQASAGLTREEAQLTIESVEGTESDIEARRVFVSSSGSLVDRWRGVPKIGEKLSGILDVRSGFRGGASMSVDGTTHLSVGHLTRARIGRMNTGGEGPSASRIVIELIRGHVEVRPVGGGVVNVLTADGITSVREPTVVSFDAVRGTVLSMPGGPDPSGKSPRTDTEKR